MEANATRIDLTLRCFHCNRFAYTAGFEGDYGTSGYMCTYCVRMLNFDAMKETRHERAGA